MADPLDHPVVHRKEPHLEGGIGEVREEGGEGDEEGDEPVGGGRGEGLGEEAEGGGGEVGGHGAVDEEEDVPEGDGAPDEEVLDEGEVRDRDRHLEVHHPHDARVHRRPQDVATRDLALPRERLQLKGLGAEEEDYHRAH